MIVVSDTSPLVNLAVVGQMDLLRALYTSIVVPPGVHDEVTVAGAGLPGAVEVRSLPWIECRAVRDTALVAVLRSEIDRGEAEAIALARELGADLLLLDERKGRPAARRLGLPVIGLLGVLIEGRHKKIVPSVTTLLDRLISEAGFHVSEALYTTVVLSAGE